MDCDCGTILLHVPALPRVVAPGQPLPQPREAQAFDDDGGLGNDEAVEFRQASQALNNGVQQGGRRGGTVADEAWIAAAVGDRNVRLLGRLEYPEAPELRRCGACGLRRKRPDGDELGIGSGGRVYAAGHPGDSAPGHAGLELEVRDACGSEVFGAGDAVVLRKYFHDIDHADIVAPKPVAGTEPGRAMCKRACPRTGAGRGHVPRPGWCTTAGRMGMSAASVRGHGHVPGCGRERRRGMCRGRCSGWTCCQYVHPWPRRLGMSLRAGREDWACPPGWGDGVRAGAPRPWPAGSAGTRPACRW